MVLPFKDWCQGDSGCPTLMPSPYHLRIQAPGEIWPCPYAKAPPDLAAQQAVRLEPRYAWRCLEVPRSDSVVTAACYVGLGCLTPWQTFKSSTLWGYVL